MKKRIGILTGGGDCPGLNAAIRGVAKALYQSMPNTEIVGVVDGYTGLINGEFREMRPEDLYGILTLGGTILGTSRQPYKTIQVVGEDKVNKVERMKDNYRKQKLDCLLTLGGNGTHKTANLLSAEGLNVIGLPKTIDNDIFGTDETFGFNTAIEIGAEVLDRLHTTAASHSRVMVVEMMGNKTGWLSLYTGLSGGSDVIVLPEIPYEPEKIAEAVMRRTKLGRIFSIIVVAEGAISKTEAGTKKKERIQRRMEEGYSTATVHIAKYIESNTGIETRIMVPGYYLRGGTPSGYDRALATQFGAYAAALIRGDVYGVTVAKKGSVISHNALSDIAGKAKPVPGDHQVITAARSVGISFGD